MDKEVQLFPSNNIQALALAYATKKAGDNAAPEDYCRLYWEAYYRIASSQREIIAEAKAKAQK